MFNIAFISANNYTNPYPVYPIGISYLETYLRGNLTDMDYSIAKFDFNLGSYDDLARFCREGNFDFIVLSLRNIDDNNLFERNSFVAHYQKVMEVIRANSNAVVEAGGAGFSIFPELLFDMLRPDYGVQGEGEQSLLELVEAVAKGTPTDSIEGLVWRDSEGKVRVNPHVNYIAAPELQIDPEAAQFYYAKSGMLNIQTKRGCPFGCIYCSYPLIDGRRVRTLDARTVVDNICRINHLYGISYFFFTDSIFNIDRNYNERLSNLLIESGVKINWGAYFSPCDLTREQLALYQRAGLTHIEWGTDSFSDRQLVNYNKRFGWDDIVRTSRYASELGIFYAHFMILGGYGETEETLDETFARSKELGLTVIFPYIGMRIYPRTKLCEIALREGVIKSESELVDPHYYVSPNIDVSTIEQRARATGQKWSFPDDPPSPMVERFRQRKRRGPLWEYLRY